MINKLLDSMIEAAKIDGCGVYNTLNVYDGIEDLDCNCDCESCERESVTRIERLKKQAISDKTSDTSSDTLSETRKELDKCIITIEQKAKGKIYVTVKGEIE